jgi:glycosyltransferase involved in cell wall biosynthesis
MISILMAAYNGEKYISEQIESLLSQTVGDFKLFIRDDMSDDNTFSIISGYADRFPDKIFVTRSGENSGSAKYNFIKLMTEHKDDYFMLCDQDDFWLPDKIEVSFAKVREMEEAYGRQTPVLVHSDLRVADEELNVISESYARDMVADYGKTSLNYLLIQNMLAGCTCMYNRALADSLREPAFTVMHDWWLVLTASAFGKIGTIQGTPSILYRQHGGNEMGAGNVRSVGHTVNKATHFEEMRAAVYKTYRQAESFLNAYRERLSAGQVELLEAYVSIPALPRIKRLRVLFKYKTFKNGLARKIAQIMVILKEKRQGVQNETF